MKTTSKKVLLITGGSDGIGAATLRLFHAQGYDVAHVSDRKPDTRLPDNIVEVYGDIADPAVRQEAVDKTMAAYGRIDVLINNAATGLYALPSETELAHAERVFAVNVFAAIGLTQLVLSIMRRQGSGTIVNIGSVAGWISMHWAAVYCASKFALHGWHDSLYRELKHTGIHAMKVCPSVTKTNFREYVIIGKAPKNVLNFRAVASPESIASAIYKGVQKKSRAVYTPIIGFIFVVGGLVAPWLMDRYLEHKAR